MSNYDRPTASDQDEEEQGESAYAIEWPPNHFTSE